MDWSNATLFVAIDACSSVRMDAAEKKPLRGKTRLSSKTLISAPHSGYSSRVLAEAATFVFWSTHGAAAPCARPQLSRHSCWQTKEKVSDEVDEKNINAKKSLAEKDVRITKENSEKKLAIVSIMRMWFNASIVPTSGGGFFEPINQSICQPTSHLFPSTSLFAPHISSYISTSIHRHLATTHKSMMFTYVSTSVSIHHNVRSPPYTTNTYNADFNYSIVQKFRSTCL